MPNQSFPATAGSYRFNPYAFPIAAAWVVVNATPKKRGVKKGAKGAGAKSDLTSRNLKLQSREATAALRQRSRLTAGNPSAAKQSRPRHFRLR